MECDGASNGNDDDTQKTGYQCDACKSCFTFDGFAGADFSTSFDGVGGMRGPDGFDGGFDGVDGVGLMASMVWVTSLKWRELRNEMLRYPPLKILQCTSTKLAWEADGSRNWRRFHDVTVKKELMVSHIWAMVVTMVWMASMASMASMVLASSALKG